MNTSTMPAQAFKVCLAVALALAANACVLVGPPSAGARSGHDVMVCHKGKKTMTLPAEAVGAHLDHGDHRGPC